MGCDYDYPPPTKEEKEQARMTRLARTLRNYPASHFTVNELALLLRTDWSEFQRHYYQAEWPALYQMAKKVGIDVDEV